MLLDQIYKLCRQLVVRQSKTIQTAGGPVQMLPAAADRYSLIWSTSATTMANIWCGADGAVANTLVLSSTANPWILTIEDAGNMVQYPWFFQSSAAPGTVTVVEIAALLDYEV